MSEELLKYLTRQNPIFGGKAKQNIITMETCHGSLLSLFFFLKLFLYRREMERQKGSQVEGVRASSKI